MKPVPRKLLIGSPEYCGVQVSPSGNFVSLLKSVEGFLNVFVAPIKKPHELTQITFSKDRSLKQYIWGSDEHILFLKDTGGDENYRVYLTEIKSLQERCITPLDKVSCHSLKRSFDNSRVSFFMNHRSPSDHDLYHLELKNINLSLCYENKEQYATLYLDKALNPRFAEKLNNDGSKTIYSLDNQSRFMEVPLEDCMGTSIVSILDKNELYLSDSRNRNTSALYIFKNGTLSAIASDPKCDLESVYSDPQSGKPIFACFNYKRKTLVSLDPLFAEDLAIINQDSNYDINTLTWSDDMGIWAVGYVSDNRASYYAIYNRSLKTLESLGSCQPDLADYQLPRTTAEVIHARDGLELLCYVTRPLHETANVKDRAAIVFIHGGPWARDSWECKPFYQFLADRGYAVISINYRGSTGFGKNHLNAGNKEWAGKMHEDVLDVADWITKQELAPKDRIAIWGGSYGGYETLVSLAFTPDVFCAGIDYVGPSNLLTLIDSFPKYWENMFQMIKDRIGDFESEEGKQFLLSRSPLSKASQIKKPLVVIQGLNDPRVKTKESNDIVKALMKHKIPVTYLLFPDEGHGCNRSENWQAVLYILERFFAQILGGSYQPIDEEVAKSSLQTVVDDFNLFSEFPNVPMPDDNI